MSSVLLERSLLLILVSRLVFNVVCVTGEIRVGHLSFTSCVQCRLCYWKVHSSVLVSLLVFNVVCVTGGIRVAHLSFTSCIQCRQCYWRDPCCSS